MSEKVIVQACEGVITCSIKCPDLQLFISDGTWPAALYSFLQIWPF